MKKALVAGTFALCLLGTSAASALVIDTNGTWDNSVNVGWDGSGQSLTVDALQNHLVSIGFYFARESHGKTFSFTLTDAPGSGTEFFSTDFVVDSSDINVINVATTLAPGSTVYALVDYNGFSGKTAHFSYTDGYAGGLSYFYSIGSGWQTYAPGLDHRFIAVFSGTAVPEPGTLAMLALGLAGLGLGRRRAH